MTICEMSRTVVLIAERRFIGEVRGALVVIGTVGQEIGIVVKNVAQLKPLTKVMACVNNAITASIGKSITQNFCVPNSSIIVIIAKEPWPVLAITIVKTTKRD